MPYALLFFYKAFVNANDDTNRLYGYFAVICAKSSLIWPSLFYLATKYMFDGVTPRRATHTHLSNKTDGERRTALANGHLTEKI